MKDVLIVVDMQNDFVSGALGTDEALAIVPAVTAAVIEAAEKDAAIVFTRDTHQSCYMETQEGKKLPVPHCIEGSSGWEIIDELKPYAMGRTIIDKPTFGSRALAELLAGMNEQEPIGSITLLGLCTDICVISNALLLKAFLPEVSVKVKAECCAGVSPESHKRALEAMAVCHIEIASDLSN